MTTQPEALRLAELFEFESDPDSLYRKAADELRRLHEVNAELLAALKVAKTIIGHPDDSTSTYIASVITKAERTTL
jgi:hypothetical protein